MRVGSAGFSIVTIPDIIISSFSVVLIPSLTPISFLQFEISHQPTQSLNLLVPFLVLVMSHGARYCSECLIRPFSKVRLFLRPFALPVLTSFLSSLLPGVPPRRPRGSTLDMASKMSFRRFSLHLGPYQITASQEIPTDNANCVPMQLDPWA